MTPEEIHKALTGEPVHDRQGIGTSTGALPTPYRVLYEKVLASTVEVDPEVMAVVNEHFWEMWEPL